MVRTLLGAALAAALAPAAASAGPTPRQLVELHDLSSLATSPDGRLIAYREDVASVDANQLRHSWWVAALDGATAPVRIGEGGLALWSAAGQAIQEAPQWSADGRFVYYRALVDGQVAVWRAAANGAGAAPVTRDEADVRAFSLTEQGLTYEVGATRAEILAEEKRQSDAGVLIDAHVDLAQSVLDAVEINGRPAMQRFSGAWFWRAGVLDDRPARRRTLVLKADGLATGPPIDVAAARPLDAPLGARSEDFGAIDLKRRASASDVVVTRPDGQIIPCPEAVCRPDKAVAAAWRPGRDEVILTLADPYRANRLVAWSPKTGAQRLVFRTSGSLQGGANNDGSCAMTRRYAVCVASAALSPPRLLRIDLETGATASLAAPNSDLRHDGLKVEPLSWTDPAGRRFTGQWLNPVGAAPGRPLFLLYYNCRGYLRGGTGDQWPMIPLAESGLSVLCINVPSSLSDEQDSEADYRTALSGIATIIDTLAKTGTIDRSRVGMGGHSFGSEVTTWVAMKSDLLAAASVSSVQLEPTYYWLNGIAGRDAHAGLRKAWKLGAPDETAERWRALAPASNVDRIKAPLLLQLPEQELRASIELISRLSASPTPSEARAFAREPHNLTQPRHRLAAYDRNLDWFRYWLLGETDPDPDKQDQYRRWKAMADRRPGCPPAR